MWKVLLGGCKTYGLALARGGIRSRINQYLKGFLWYDRQENEEVILQQCKHHLRLLLQENLKSNNNNNKTKQKLKTTPKLNSGFVEMNVSFLLHSRRTRTTHLLCNLTSSGRQSQCCYPKWQPPEPGLTAYQTPSIFPLPVFAS